MKDVYKPSEYNKPGGSTPGARTGGDTLAGAKPASPTVAIDPTNPAIASTGKPNNTQAEVTVYFEKWA